MGFGSVIGFIGPFDTARDYTLQFSITHTSVYSHIFTSRCSVTASTADVTLPVDSRIVPGLSYQQHSESESYVTADGESTSLSWDKAPIWYLRPDFYYCQTVAGLFLWSSLCNERTGLQFAIAAGLRQRSRSRVWVLWETRPYFTVLDSRLPFPSPPTTRRTTVEVFDPASTRDDPATLLCCL
jgi:hypothetical protein